MVNMFGILAKPRWLCFVLLWLLSAAIVAACGGASEPAYGHQVILQGAAQLVCSQECFDRGQCGLVPGTEDRMVLVGWPDTPSATPRQFALLSGTQVSIAAEPQLVSLLLRQDPNARENVHFYLVTVPERNNAPGWVGGWCLQSP